MNQSDTTASVWTLLLFPTICFGQLSNSEILESNAEFREEINHDYADSTKSPLTKEDFSKFSGLPFFCRYQLLFGSSIQTIKKKEVFQNESHNRPQAYL
jgi:hypothetical protein